VVLAAKCARTFPISTFRHQKTTPARGRNGTTPRINLPSVRISGSRSFEPSPISDLGCRGHTSYPRKR
jgi:hypothetical protein